jgi:ribosomal protein S1
MSENNTDLLESVTEKELSQKTPETIDDLEPKMMVSGSVKRLELYGAIIDIGVGKNAILHISKFGGRVNRVSDVLGVDDDVTVWVDSVDKDSGQVTVTMIEPYAVDWSDIKIGQVYNGKVTRLENFGAFVDIGAEKEGLVHVSELSHDYIKHPSQAVKLEEEIQVIVLGFNKRKRRIDLSRKMLLELQEEAAEEELDSDDEDEDIVMPTAMEMALKRAMSDSIDSDSDSTESVTEPASRNKRMRKQQEDILNRTLKLGDQ